MSAACPACGAPEPVLTLMTTWFRYYRCLSCGLIWSVARPGAPRTTAKSPLRRQVPAPRCILSRSAWRSFHAFPPLAPGLILISGQLALGKDMPAGSYTLEVIVRGKDEGKLERKQWLDFEIRR